MVLGSIAAAYGSNHVLATVFETGIDGDNKECVPQ
jgi:hypothetical protein